MSASVTRPERPEAAGATGYVEFATASNFSFLRGASHSEELIGAAVDLGLGGLGLADRNSVAGVVRAHSALTDLNRARSETGAPAATFRYHPGARLAFTDGTPDILAYPRHRAGWGRLCRMLTRGNRRAPKGECHLTFSDLVEHCDGLSLIVMPGDGQPTDDQRRDHRRDNWDHPGAAPHLLASRLEDLARANPGFVRLAARMTYTGLDRRRLAAQPPAPRQHVCR